MRRRRLLAGLRLSATNPTIWDLWVADGGHPNSICLHLTFDCIEFVRSSVSENGIEIFSALIDDFPKVIK